MGVNEEQLLNGNVITSSRRFTPKRIKIPVMDNNACFPPVAIQRGNPSQYFRYFFDFCYFVCIIPFRFEFDGRKNAYELKTHPGQRAICLAILLCCIMEEVLAVREMVQEIHYPTDGHDDPLAYFEVFNSVSNFVYYFTLIRTMWCKSGRFLALMNVLAESESRQEYFQDRRNSSNLKAKLWISISLAAFILYPGTYGVGFFLRRSYSGWTEIVDLWSGQAAQVFFIEGLIENSHILIKIIFALARIAFLVSYTQISTAMELLLFHSAMLLHDAVQDFGKMAKDASGVGCEQILEEYTRLRNISKKLNKAVGLLTFGLTLACMPYYVVNLLQFIKPQNASVFIRHLMFFFNVFGFLTLAAITHKKALVFQEWILATRNFSEVPIPRLCILLHDMSGGHIGFSGSGFFKVTTSFLGTIISLLLTFSIIIIQFKTSSTGGSGSSAAAFNIMT